MKTFVVERAVLYFKSITIQTSPYLLLLSVALLNPTHTKERK